jgi:hypothetical protein
VSETGFRQGYYIGLFGRFLWFFLIYFVLQSTIIYIFDYNWFTYWALIMIFSFIINTSLPMGESYAFLRHGLILFCLLVAHSYTSSHLMQSLFLFFTPNLTWKLILIVSFLFGVAASFGRYSNGTNSKNIESISNLSLFIFLVLCFILFWWKGGLVYLLFRIIFMFIEVIVANILLQYLMRKNEAKYDIGT